MSYLNNPTQYVVDLTSAAEAEDWGRYQQVQSQLAVESTLSALQQVQQQAAHADDGRKAAIQAADSKVPGFANWHGSSGYQEALKSAPSLGNAIVMAEGNSNLQADLADFYVTLHKIAIADGLTQSSTNSRRNPAPEEPIGLASSRARRNLIAEFEQRHGDVSLDLDEFRQP